MKGQRIKTGDVVRIALEAGYVHAVVLNDGAIGIIKSTCLEKSEICAEDLYIVAYVFDTAFKSGEWLRVGRVKFKSEVDSWARPMRVIDILSPQMRQVYHRGSVKKVEFDVSELEEFGLYKPSQYRERVQFSLKPELGRDFITSCAKWRES